MLDDLRPSYVMIFFLHVLGNGQPTFEVQCILDAYHFMEQETCSMQSPKRHFEKIQYTTFSMQTFSNLFNEIFSMQSPKRRSKIFPHLGGVFLADTLFLTVTLSGFTPWSWTMSCQCMQWEVVRVTVTLLLPEVSDADSKRPSTHAHVRLHTE